MIDSDQIPLQYIKAYRKVLRDVVDWLNFAPVVDAVLIVRCKDCRFLIERKDGSLGCYRNFMDYTELDNFCNYGERVGQKMWTKFKRWLIRKLGGYTAPCIKCSEYKNTLLEITRPVETIRTMYRIDDPIWVNRDDAHDVIENAIRYDIGSRVMHSDYIKLTEHDDCIYGSLKVVKQSQ